MQGPVEVHAGVRSDPYFYEEVSLSHADVDSARESLSLGRTQVNILGGNSAGARCRRAFAASLE